MVNLLPSSEQQQIVDSVVDFLKNRCPVERLRKREEPAGATERREWGQFAALGWFGFGLSEELGGVGFTLAEETLAFREFGRFLLSSSVLASSLGAQLAARSGDRALADAILSGASRVALALPAGAAGSLKIGPKVDGALQLIDAQDAELCVLWNTSAAALVRRSALADIQTVPAMDTSITMERAIAAGAGVAAWLPAKECPLHLHASVLIAAQLSGGAEAARDLGAAYAKIREQFGKPIGSFQAISHHCADMAMRAETAWVQTKFAAIAARDGRADALFQVSSAILLAAEAAFQNATISIRIHGGIGFTADCDVHHYLKRAVMLRQAAGGARLHQTLLLAESAAA